MIFPSCTTISTLCSAWPLPSSKVPARMTTGTFWADAVRVDAMKKIKSLNSFIDGALYPNVGTIAPQENAGHGCRHLMARIQNRKCYRSVAQGQYTSVNCS